MVLSNVSLKFQVRLSGLLDVAPSLAGSDVYSSSLKFLRVVFGLAPCSRYLSLSSELSFLEDFFRGDFLEELLKGDFLKYEDGFCLSGSSSSGSKN